MSAGRAAGGCAEKEGKVDSEVAGEGTLSELHEGEGSDET